MIELKQSDAFQSWLRRFKDASAKGRILDRLDRVRDGNFGDHEPVGSGIFELRFHFGPGYRIYYLRERDTVVVLLAGGDKSTQAADIAKAKKIAGEWRSQ